MDPPPPNSLAPETHAIRLAPATRWHPKMSPYRFFVIVTTVVMGTSKAGFTYRGESKVSTTLEWISGVVITLLIFVLDEWEYKEIYPKRLRWFFKFDCTELMWKILRIFSISRPRYRSDEVTEGLTNSTFVPVTGYRMLVSATVVSLGSVKVALAYLGHNTTANGFDWTLTVLVTSLLYCIGLYQYNSINMAPNFFVRDYFTLFTVIVRDILVMFVLGVFTYGSTQWAALSLSGFNKSRHEFATIVPSESEFFFLGKSLGISMLCIWALSLTLSLSGVVATLISILWALQQKSELFNFLFRRGKFTNFYDNLTGLVLKMNARLLQLLHRARRIAYPVLRVIIHFFWIILLSSMLFVSIGSMALFGDTLHNGNWVGSVVMWFFLGGYGILLLCGLYYLFRSLILPFLLPARPVVFA